MKYLDKKVYIWGTGNAANIALKYCISNDVKVTGFVDSDADKRRFYIGFFVAEAVDTEYENYAILAPSEVQSIDDAFFIVAAFKKYNEIVSVIREAGYTDYVSVSDLTGATDYRVNDSCKEQYARICVERAPINDKAVLFLSYGNYTDHEKYISAALQKRNDRISLWWLAADYFTEFPEDIHIIYKDNWKAYIRAFETAKIWISDMPVDNIIHKRSDQIYIQTKHWASLTFKKFYMDTRAFRDDPERYQWIKKDGKRIDFVITGSEFDRESCQRGMGVEEGFLDFGSPRTDALFRLDELKRKVFEYYRLSEDIRVLLYAPTYRFDKNKGSRYHVSRKLQLDYEMIKKALETRFGGNWIIMLRLHPSVIRASNGMVKRDYVVNSSCYEDSEELVAASDIVVTDFSSIGMEPAFVKKITMLFATDLDEYIENEYELLLDYRSLPFPIAATNEHLAENILNFDQEKYEKDVTAFLDKYGVHEDGHASERAADFILGLLEDSD